MKKPLRPLVRGGGYYPSDKGIPFVYPGGFTTSNEKNRSDESNSETDSDSLIVEIISEKKQ